MGKDLFTLFELDFTFLFCKFFNVLKVFEVIKKFNAFKVLAKIWGTVPLVHTILQSQKEFILSLQMLVSSLLKSQWDLQSPTLWWSPTSVAFVGSATAITDRDTNRILQGVFSGCREKWSQTAACIIELQLLGFILSLALFCSTLLTFN